MNKNQQLWRQDSIESDGAYRHRHQPPATTTAKTTVQATRCRHADFGGGGGGVDGGVDGRRQINAGLTKASNRRAFAKDNAEVMAASAVALLERFPQPIKVTTSAAQTLNISDDRDDHGLLLRRQYDDNRDRVYRPSYSGTKYNSVSASSALSKSMRYADGWLYEKEAPVAGGTVGGGRNCYKTRSTFFGHEHFRTSVAATCATAITQPATEDPYDRVRKNRMAGTSSAISSGKPDKKRYRSGSPRTPSPDYDDRGDVTASSTRRSILECDVNPYDLLSRVESDEDHEANDRDGVSEAKSKRMSLKDKFMHRIQDTVFTRNRTSIGGFNSFSNGSAKKTITGDINNGGVNIAGHTVRLFDGKNSVVNTKSAASSTWYDDGSASDSVATIDAAVKSLSPTRPPRRRRNKFEVIVVTQGLTKRSHSLTAGTTPAASEIKSILKKPAYLTTDDLSPVRSWVPVTVVDTVPDSNSLSTVASYLTSGSQKKAKKQVQFDIVPVTPEKPSGCEAKSETVITAEHNTLQSKLLLQQKSTGATDTMIVAAVGRKLKRSLSDRQNSGNGSDDMTIFNDTMRIHVRHKSRQDSREVFERPANPPPPPPPPPPKASSTTSDSVQPVTVSPMITELFLYGNRKENNNTSDARDEANKTVVQVSSSSDNHQKSSVDRPVEPEQKTSILINSSPRLKTSVIIGEGGAAYAATSDNKVTISIGPRKCAAMAGRGGGGNYRSNVMVVDRTGSRMSDFIRMNYDPVEAARLNVTPHVCGRRSSSATPLVDPYRVSEIEKHHESSVDGSGDGGDAPSDTESSSAESCYASAKEDASYSSASSFSSSSTSAVVCNANDKDVLPTLQHPYDAEPIYEEISESPPPPPLPLCPPPERADLNELPVCAAIPSRSIFEGATKYDIINYLVDAKRRCGALHDTNSTNGTMSHPKFVVVSDDLHSASELDACNGAFNDSGEEYGGGTTVLGSLTVTATDVIKKASVDIERNDSGVGSETSQSSRSKWQQQHETQHSCEDCDQSVEIQTTDGGIMFAPLVCRKCHKRRAERREIIAEIVETEEKYGRDLDIITEEFYRPMMVAGLLNADQLTSVFLNVSELKEHSAALSQRLRDAYEIAVEQGDDDLLTVNIGRLFLEASPSMLHAFQSYCTRQGNAALLLANLEKEKELLRIFLRVSQMENAVLRRMNLNSFLMVPVQRVTKYPLLLARLYKVTPEHHLEARQTLNEARHKIQLHLEHINSLAKDISSTKLWRKIYAINGKRPDNEDLADIKFRKVAVDVLEWSGLGEEIRFAMEGRLLYTQPSDHNWRRGGRTIKLMPINAIIVTLGKPNDCYNPDADDIVFPRQNGIRDASLVMLKEKSGRVSLLREPMYLDRCIVYCENDWDDYFELHEITTKDTYILKSQDGEQTKLWYRQLQYHCQALGCWRKRRNALANIMINRNCT